MFLLKVYLFGEKYANICIEKNGMSSSAIKIHEPLGLPEKYFNLQYAVKVSQRKCLRVSRTAIFIKPFITECSVYPIYRHEVIKNVQNLIKLNTNNIDHLQSIMVLKLNLLPPDKDIIDYSWNDKITKLVCTKIELESAFAWWSTLGGAYSALGDYFEYCAEEAGRIAVKQYKMSLMLGDEGLAARSRLYAALSLSQKGKLKISRYIVRNVANFAVESKDKRLLRMCHGIWAKLQYLRTLKYSKNHLVGEGGDNVLKNGKC